MIGRPRLELPLSPSAIEDLIACGASIAAVARQCGMSRVTFHRRRKESAELEEAIRRGQERAAEAAGSSETARILERVKAAPLPVARDLATPKVESEPEPEEPAGHDPSGVPVNAHWPSGTVPDRRAAWRRSFRADPWPILGPYIPGRL